MYRPAVFGEELAIPRLKIPIPLICTIPITSPYCYPAYAMIQPPAQMCYLPKFTSLMGQCTYFTVTSSSSRIEPVAIMLAMSSSEFAIDSGSAAERSIE